MRNYTEARREYFKKRYTDNRDRILLANKEWNRKNPDKIRAAGKRWQENKTAEERRICWRIQYANNPKSAIERQKRYYLANREKRLKYAAERQKRLPKHPRPKPTVEQLELRRTARQEYARKHRQNNIEMYRNRVRKRRAQKRGAIGSYTNVDWESRVLYYGWCCRYCSCALTRKTLTMEHAIPLSRGGSNWPSNLVPACAKCNTRKGTKTIFEFLRILCL